MNHDRYDNDILKQLKRIADSLEKIAKANNEPVGNIKILNNDHDRKTCNNCKSINVNVFDQPCKSCHGKDKWKERNGSSEKM